MIIAMKRTGLVAALAALAVAGACKKNQPIDDALKADLAAAGGSAGTSSDLQLAPNSAKNQMVVSAVEGGPKAAPAHATPTRVAKPSTRSVARVAPRRTTAPAPVETRAETPAPAPSVPVIEAPAPAPSPAPAPREDHRVYKTEGEIFRQMPWIRP